MVRTLRMHYALPPLNYDRNSDTLYHDTIATIIRLARTGWLGSYLRSLGARARVLLRRRVWHLGSFLRLFFFGPLFLL